MQTSQVITTREPLAATDGVVAAGHDLEAQAGVRMLAAGGNAIDAAVAAAFVAQVVEPYNCGPGGMTMMSVYLAEHRRVVVIDAASRAPAAARPDLYEIEGAPAGVYRWPAVKGRANSVGHRAVAVPGAIAGLCLAVERFGWLPLEQVIAPAIELAANGIPVDWRLTLAIANNVELIRRFPATAALLLPNDAPLRTETFYTTGSRIRQPELARTLELVAEQGAAGFYRGETARAIAREMAGHGGLITEEDLAGYQARLLPQETLHTYRDYQYCSGLCPHVVQMLNILEQFDLAAIGPDSIAYRHLMIEVMRQTWTDQLAHATDPERDAGTADALLSKEYARAVAATIDMTAANRARLPAVALRAPEQVDAHTTQVCAADRAGNLVALRTSLGELFGSKVLIPGTGVFMNNSLQAFNPQPGHPNSLAPGQRSAMIAPAVVMLRQGRPFAAIAASGGRRTTAAAVHVMAHLTSFGMPIQAAIEWPRLHCEIEEVFLDARIPGPVQNALRELGHPVVAVEETVAAANFGRPVGVVIDEQNGSIQGGADPLRSTGVAGWSAAS